MKNELNQIQWLRAIAAILVVITHFTGKAYSVKLLDHEFSSGAIGVDIFFIISGFIM
ncbi:TPA: acyltransferase family protein, partial [Klebsiella pneumoniae]|nr:acyltransferase family protein [Klebsiella pneumoniae]